MDSIINYLPAPKEIKHSFLDHYSPTDICAMAFKIVHHPQKGIRTFIRVYSGTLKEGDSVFNVNLGRSEKITRLYIAFADDFRYMELYCLCSVRSFLCIKVNPNLVYIFI